MKKVRKNVFETNSSSTNSLCISLTNIKIPKKITVIDNSWGGGRNFEIESVDEKFTLMVSLCQTADELLALCYKMYKFGVEVIELPSPKEFYLDEKDDYLFVSSGGEIEDPEELRELLKDEENLKAFIFGEYSYISGEDNNY